MTQLLQPYIPGLVQVMVVEFLASGRPAIPAGRRDEVVRMLQSVVCSQNAVNEYSGLLGDEFGDEIPPDPIGGLPYDAIIRDGLAMLSDDQLAHLALSIVDVDDLGERIFAQEIAAPERLGPWWHAAYQDIVIPAEYLAAGERAVAEFCRLERETRPTTDE